MADNARDRMVDSAIKLLAAQGFQGASFSSILEDSKAPREARSTTTSQAARTS